MLSRVDPRQVASQEAGSKPSADDPAASAATLGVEWAGEGKFITRFNGKLYQFMSASDRLVFLGDPGRHAKAQLGATRP